MSDVPDGYYLNGKLLLDFRREPNLVFFQPLIRPKKNRRTKIGSEKKRRLYAALLLRDGCLCHYCEVEMIPTEFNRQPLANTMTLDHVIPACYGGSNAQTNLVLACYKCNNERGTEMFYCNCNFCLPIYNLFKE